MQHADETLLSVVVLEARALWPAWLGEYQKHAPNSVVIAQSGEEPGARFAQRINRRMHEVASSDTKIHAALLVSNGALDDASVATRKEVCTSLLRVMVDKRYGELVLAAEALAGDDIRHELFSLAGTLCDDVRGTPVNVRVRFGSVRPGADTLRPSSDSARPGSAVSGVMKSVVPPPLADLEEEADERIAQNGRD